jgi:hypothetical protein
MDTAQIGKLFLKKIISKPVVAYTFNLSERRLLELAF